MLKIFAPPLAIIIGSTSIVLANNFVLGDLYTRISIIGRILFVSMFFLVISLLIIFIFNSRKDLAKIIGSLFDFQYFLYFGMGIGLFWLTTNQTPIPGGFIYGDLGRIINWAIDFREDGKIGFYSPAILLILGKSSEIFEVTVTELTKPLWITINIVYAYILLYLVKRIVNEKFASLFLLVFLPTFFLDYRSASLLTTLFILFIATDDLVCERLGGGGNQKLANRQRLILGIILGLSLTIYYAWTYWLWAGVAVLLAFSIANRSRLFYLEKYMYYSAGLVPFISVLFLIRRKTEPALILTVFILVVAIYVLIHLLKRRFKISYEIILVIHAILSIVAIAFVYATTIISDNYLAPIVDISLAPLSPYGEIMQSNSASREVILGGLIATAITATIALGDTKRLRSLSIFLVFLVMSTFVYSIQTILITRNNDIALFQRGIAVSKTLIIFILLIIIYLIVEKYISASYRIDLPNIILALILVGFALISKNIYVSERVYPNENTRNSLFINQNTCLFFDTNNFDFIKNNNRMAIDVIIACDKIGQTIKNYYLLDKNFSDQEIYKNEIFYWANNKEVEIVIGNVNRKVIEFSIQNPPCINTQTVSVITEYGQTTKEIIGRKKEKFKVYLGEDLRLTEIQILSNVFSCKVENDERNLQFKLFFNVK